MTLHMGLKARVDLSSPMLLCCLKIIKVVCRSYVLYTLDCHLVRISRHLSLTGTFTGGLERNVKRSQFSCFSETHTC